jgi:hypothetical protein
MSSYNYPLISLLETHAPPVVLEHQPEVVRRSFFEAHGNHVKTILAEELK